MKSIINALLLSFPFFLFAQSPSGINYQGVARDNNGVIIINTPIAIRSSIIIDTPTGVVQYVEEHSAQTNAFGLFNIIIGQGTFSGGIYSTVQEIKWGNSQHFLKVEMDILGGTNFSEMGTMQIMTVPYSFYSEEAGRLKGGSSAKTILYLGGM
jgi:hypothetical protein